MSTIPEEQEENYFRGLEGLNLDVTKKIIESSINIFKENPGAFSAEDIDNILSGVCAYYIEAISKKLGLGNIDRLEFEHQFRSNLNKQIIHKLNPAVTILDNL